MSEVFTRIRNAAKQTKADDNELPTDPARLLIFGHSFGGLIVEQAMSQMLISSLAPEHVKEMEHCRDGSLGIRQFADLVLLINPAADSIEANETIDLMKRSRAHVCSDNGVAAGLNPPVIISIHARNDAATGRLFAFGHTVEQLNKAFRKRDDECDFCNSGVGKPPTEGFLFRHTPGHAIYLANYCYVNAEFTGDWVCEEVKQRVRAAMAKFSLDDGRSMYELFASEGDPSRRAQLLRSVEDLLAVPIPDPSVANASLLMNLYKRSANPDRHPAGSKLAPWNDTPYWIFTVPKDIVDQHSGFWTDEFTQFIGAIVTATTPRGGTTLQIQ